MNPVAELVFVGVIGGLCYHAAGNPRLPSTLGRAFLLAALTLHMSVAMMAVAHAGSAAKGLPAAQGAPPGCRIVLETERRAWALPATLGELLCPEPLRR